MTGRRDERAAARPGRGPARDPRGGHQLRVVLAAAVVAAVGFAPALDADARRPPRPLKKPVEAAAQAGPECVGPFTVQEVELYTALGSARERIAAAEAALALREQLLQAREQELVLRLESLVELEQRIDARLAELEEDEGRLHRLADELGEREEQAGRAPVAAAGEAEDGPKAPPEEVARARRMNARQLAVMVRSMRPAAAAQLLAELPSGLSTEVLSRLPARQAGRILSVMEPGAASGLSVAFIHRDAPGEGDGPGAGGGPGAAEGGQEPEGTP